MAAFSDHQFSMLSARRTPDVRIGLQYIDRRDDVFNALLRIGNLMSAEVLQNPVEVLKYLRRELDFRHVRA